jgi:hypothetical protein
LSGGVDSNSEDAECWFFLTANGRGEARVHECVLVNAAVLETSRHKHTRDLIREGVMIGELLLRQQIHKCTRTKNTSNAIGYWCVYCTLMIRLYCMYSTTTCTYGEGSVKEKGDRQYMLCVGTGTLPSIGNQ